MKVKVGANWYTVTRDKDDNLPERAADCGNLDHKIRVHEKAIKAAFRHILLHEVLHAANWESDEKEIEHWTVVLEQILVDNQWFTKLFIK